MIFAFLRAKIHAKIRSFALNYIRQPADYLYVTPTGLLIILVHIALSIAIVSFIV